MQPEDHTMQHQEGRYMALNADQPVEMASLNDCDVPDQPSDVSYFAGNIANGCAKPTPDIGLALPQDDQLALHPNSVIVGLPSDPVSSQPSSEPEAPQPLIKMVSLNDTQPAATIPSYDNNQEPSDSGAAEPRITQPADGDNHHLVPASLTNNAASGLKETIVYHPLDEEMEEEEPVDDDEDDQDFDIKAETAYRFIRVPITAAAAAKKKPKTGRPKGRPKAASKPVKSTKPRAPTVVKPPQQPVSEEEPYITWQPPESEDTARPCTPPGDTIHVATAPTININEQQEQQAVAPGGDAAAAAAEQQQQELLPASRRRTPNKRAAPISEAIPIAAERDGSIAKRTRKGAYTTAGPPVSPTEDIMVGCPKCRYKPFGCGACRIRPHAYRPKARWYPSKGHPQPDTPIAPSFRPTLEEFKDPIAYISRITPEACQYGLAHIIPPEGWEPPFALEKGTNGVALESFKFVTRRQATSYLCRRHPPPAKDDTVKSDGLPTEGRYAHHRKMSSQPMTATATITSPTNAPAAVKVEEEPAITAITKEEEPVPMETDAAVVTDTQPEEPPPVSTGLTAADVAAALAAVNGSAKVAIPVSEPTTTTPAETTTTTPVAVALPQQPQQGELDEADNEFGFLCSDKKHTLRTFAAYADWVKAVHFSEPAATGQGTSSAPRHRPEAVAQYYVAPTEPSVEEIEAEFWRIVEDPEAPKIESLYGQDLDSGHHGSGFPLPEWRRRLLEKHINDNTYHNPATPFVLPPIKDEHEAEYAHHAWNINNMPRSNNSVLRYLLGDELITGVMVPWLYIGSCMSAFCWHVEDHALYSVNYHHLGAPKVWYAVPPSATQALEEAMKDALPHLFNASPNLLYQLVTMMSPQELKKRGIPVYKVVHEARSFVVTMPNAYHAGFNTGFNCAEAVNFAASNWIPYGTDVADKYRSTCKPTTMSHDSLIVSLVTAAQHVNHSLLVDDTVAIDTDNTQKQEEQAEEDYGPLGHIPWAHAAVDGICLATGELSQRILEEKRRIAAGREAASLTDYKEHRRMDSDAPPAARDPETNVLINGADCDCVECNCDLWLSAVVCPTAPTVATCPEHCNILVEKHGCNAQDLVFLYRHTCEELEELVETSVKRIKGAKEAVEEAAQRKAKAEAEAVKAQPAGPLYDIAELPPPEPSIAVTLVGLSPDPPQGLPIASPPATVSPTSLHPKKTRKTNNKNKKKPASSTTVPALIQGGTPGTRLATVEETKALLLQGGILPSSSVAVEPLHSETVLAATTTTVKPTTIKATKAAVKTKKTAVKTLPKAPATNKGKKKGGRSLADIEAMLEAQLEAEDAMAEAEAQANALNSDEEDYGIDDAYYVAPMKQQDVMVAEAVQAIPSQQHNIAAAKEEEIASLAASIMSHLPPDILQPPATAPIASPSGADASNKSQLPSAVKLFDSPLEATITASPKDPHVLSPVPADGLGSNGNGVVKAQPVVVPIVAVDNERQEEEQPMEDDVAPTSYFTFG